MKRTRKKVKKQKAKAVARNRYLLESRSSS